VGDPRAPNSGASNSRPSSDEINEACRALLAIDPKDEAYPKAWAAFVRLRNRSWHGLLMLRSRMSRYGSWADLDQRSREVRFAPMSGHCEISRSWDSRVLRRYSRAGYDFSAIGTIVGQVDYGGCPRIVGHTLTNLNGSRSRQTRDRWRLWRDLSSRQGRF
jgi:hypothetical protein